mgnify:CR=1 FL=1
MIEYGACSCFGLCMSQQQVNWNQCLQHVAVTDIGMRRSNNQDSYSVVLASDVEHWYQRGHMFIVADGMGAHAAGELASKLAVDGIPHLYHKHHDVSPPEALQRAIQDTNIEVNRRGEANADFKSMGTTSSVLVMLPQGALIAHIGDSRIYRLRGEKLRQLTFDHSLVWEMKANGKLPEGIDVGQVVPKNVITRSLGPNARVKIDFEGPFPVAVGDTFLLCSDGLTGRVEDEELAAFMAHMPPREAAAALTNLANVRGGPDNITIIIVKVIDPQITTSAVQAEPLVLGAEQREQRDVHPAIWVVTGVCALAALVMAVLGNVVAALTAGCFGIVGAMVGILQKFGSFKLGGRKEVALTEGRRLGGGPYTETDIPTKNALAKIIQDAVARSTNTSQKRNHEMDFDHVRREAAAAIDAAKAGDNAKALQTFSQTIDYMLERIRQQQKEAASDSNVL